MFSVMLLLYNFGFLGHNNEKMESLEPMIQRTKEWVDRVSGDIPEVKDLLDRDLERVEHLIRKTKNHNDQYVEIFVHAGNSLLHVIVVKGIKCILSETVYKMDQDKNLPKVLQPNVEEIKSHLKSFKAKLVQVETTENNLNKKASSFCLT